MRIVLVNPSSGTKPVARDMAGGLGFGTGSTVQLPPLDLCYMAATLENKGHQACIIDADAKGLSNDDCLQAISSMAPDVVVATVSLPTMDSDCSFLRTLRSHKSVRTLAKTGIVHSPLVRQILETSAAEMLIFGECDLAIADILAGTVKSGTAILEDGEVAMRGNLTVEYLDQLPIPARHLLCNENYSYVLLGKRVTTMQTSRGCPFPCYYYCPYPLVQGRKWRARSPRHVYQEIENIVNVYGIRKILFRDATFTLDKERTLQICRLLLQSRLDIEWWCETRVDRLDEELLVMMRDAGCKGINVGVETGDQLVMKAQAKTGLTLEKLKSLKWLAEQIDLKLHFLLMVGLPMETRESLYNTFRLVRELQPHSIGVTVITPYPGTPLYNEASLKGWIETTDFQNYDGNSPVMHTDNLTLEEIQEARLNIVRAFSWRPMNPLKHKLGLAALDCYMKLWSKL